MQSGPVFCIVFEGLDAVKTGRAMLGATNPLASQPGASRSRLFPRRVPVPLNVLGLSTGTIRGDYALAVGRNICHGSDSVENAEKEIKLYVVFYRRPWRDHSPYSLGGSLRELCSTTLARQT